MAIIRWRPLSEIDKFFDELSLMPFINNRSLLATDVYEENNTIFVKMQVPGITPENIDITIEGDYLHVKGQQEEEKESDKRNYYRKEIRTGMFETTVHLPSAVNPDQVSADFKDGVLTITLPKRTPEEQQRKIKVTTRQNKVTRQKPKQ